MMFFGLLFPILLIAALAYAFGWRPGQSTNLGSSGNQGSSWNRGSSGSRQTPLDVLKERYARGEISREVYEEMRQDLQ